MVEIKTIGREVYPGVEIALKVYKDLKIIPKVPLNTTYQIIIFEKGTCIVKTDKDRSLVHAPFIFLLNEQETITLEKAVDMKIHIVYFQPSIIDIKFSLDYVRQASREDVTHSQVQDLYWLNTFLIRDESLPNHYQITNIALHRLLNLMDNIEEEFDKQHTYLWICRGRSYFLELICYISKFPATGIPNMDVPLDSKADLLEEILLYIHANYTNTITLNDLVKQFNINRTTINEMFRKSIGESLISYIIKLRIEASSLMLRDTGIPVKEIGYRVGFNDIAYFSRTFKKQKGCSPIQYRKDNSWLLQLS